MERHVVSTEPFRYVPVVAVRRSNQHGRWCGVAMVVTHRVTRSSAAGGGVVQVVELDVASVVLGDWLRSPGTSSALHRQRHRQLHRCSALQATTTHPVTRRRRQFHDIFSSCVCVCVCVC